MRLGQLYHWSPAGRHPSIARDGLRPFSPNVTCTAPSEYICASPDPRTAWNLSGALADVSGHSSAAWDLWQFDIAPTDEIHIRAEFGPHIQEIQIRNTIPAERLFHVGRRTP